MVLSKTGIIILALVLALLVALTITGWTRSTTTTITAPAPERYYSMTTEVVAVDYRLDLVTVEDSCGSLWQFYGAEDWECGDFCSCLMDNMGTAEIYDDAILGTTYCGTLESWG